jgi:hypothetical protein
VLRRLVNGYQVSQAIPVAATLGLAELLRDGARGSDELPRRPASARPRWTGCCARWRAPIPARGGGR